MKAILFLFNSFVLLCILFCARAVCQVPEAINYQAVVRDGLGNVMPDQQVNFRLSIRKGSLTGSVVYSESHVKTTNQFGQATLEIGRGTVLSGTFSTINWGADSYYLQTEFDSSCNNNYIVMGISQFLTVPYAEYAKIAGNALPNGTQGQTLRFNGTSWVADSFLYDDGTRIGIGNTNPNYPLDITGDLNFSGTLRKKRHCPGLWCINRQCLEPFIIYGRINADPFGSAGDIGRERVSFKERLDHILQQGAGDQCRQWK